MQEYEFGEPITVFLTVGMLRELVKNYPDKTPITVCGTPGVFYPDEETGCILLETLDSGDTLQPEYMDF